MNYGRDLQLPGQAGHHGVRETILVKVGDPADNMSLTLVLKSEGIRLRDFTARKELRYPKTLQTQRK